MILRATREMRQERYREIFKELLEIIDRYIASLDEVIREKTALMKQLEKEIDDQRRRDNRTRLLTAIDELAVGDGWAGETKARTVAGLSGARIKQTIFDLRGVVETGTTTVSCGPNGKGKRTVKAIRRRPDKG